MIKKIHSQIKILILFTLMFSVNTFAFEPFYYEYSSKISGFRVKSERSLTEYEPGIYELKIRSSNMVARYEEVSRFSLDENGYPIPLENWTKSKIFGVGRTAKNIFDWEKGIATYTKKDQVKQVEISSGVLDRLVYQLLLAEDLKEGKTILEYSFSDRGQIKNYAFENLGLETVKIDKSEYQAFRIKRVTEENDRETQFWISPELDYQLIRLTHREKDGSDYEMNIKL